MSNHSAPLSKMVPPFSQVAQRLLRGKEADTSTTEQPDVIRNRLLSAVLLKVPPITLVSI
jgi:hypothetical protein